MSDSIIAFALGGLAGNNAHGAGFLQAALEENVEPAMISCTSGQIFWTHKYLVAKEGREKHKEEIHLRTVLAEKIREMHPFVNPDLNTLWLWLQGIPGVCRPSFLKWSQDLAGNTLDFIAKIGENLGSSWVFKSWLEIFPNRFYEPVFTDQFIHEIAEGLNNSPIGIIFNAYNPTEGQEFIYLNSAARKWLGRAKKKPSNFVEGARASYRERSTYKDITDDAIRHGLWLYQYGFEGKKKNVFLDGAYYRQIMLNELTYARHIFAVRPIALKWLDALPTNYVETEDLKTEVAFDGAYAGEKHQINLINKLLEDGSLSRDKYHKIVLYEVPLTMQRGFFDYIYESLAVFDKALEQSRKIFNETVNNIYEEEKLAA